MKGLSFSSENSERMPVLFVGHGSPMYTIEENEFVHSWRNLGKTIQVPEAVICISAHWQTPGTCVTAMQEPPTIHDFGGFPRELYNIQYPAPGSPELANQIKKIVKGSVIELDSKWGLDHGAWSPIRHIFPAADIPVVELSLDMNKTPQFHYDLAKELISLRNKRVLIIGSGNIVHNLGKVAWDHSDEPEFGYDWAIQANDIFKRLIISGNHQDLINYKLLGKEVQLSVPSPEHFLPLLYALALKEENEPIAFFNDKAVMGSLTMTSLIIG
jgi:4,5-DOPA dioxygenase extradiol